MGERVADVGAWNQRSQCPCHSHEIDPISRDILSGSYIRQHVPSYTQRPVDGGCGSVRVGGFRESDTISISELPQPSKFRSWKLE
eukprot:3296639-Amphidinium_carterae.1